MRGELLTAGYLVDVVVVNATSGTDTVGQLLERCSYPVFQDTADVAAWTMHDGAKDDIYVFNEEGVLTNYLPANGLVSTNLSTAAGYEHLRRLVTDLASKSL